MADLVSKILEANKQGWYLLNMYQFGDDRWKINLHYRQPKGNHVSEYSEGRTADEAFDAVWKTAQARMAAMKPEREAIRVLRPTDLLTDKQAKRVERALMALHFAVKMDNGRPRSGDREDDL